MSAAERR